MDIEYGCVTLLLFISLTSFNEWIIKKRHDNLGTVVFMNNKGMSLFSTFLICLQLLVKMVQQTKKSCHDSLNNLTLSLLIVIML